MTVQRRLQQMLETVAAALGEALREQVVFVGGCTTALFVTDRVTLEDARATNDVDLIVNLAGYAAWEKMQKQLRGKGFVEAPGEPVICRMLLGTLNVDFMPDNPDILGFSNRWYAEGIATATPFQLGSGLAIRVLTPALFVATKLAAYLGRGGDDPLGSHDLEDVLIVVDGRPELVSEVQRANDGVRRFIAEQLTALLDHRGFEHLLEGNIRGPQGRVGIVRGRLIAMSRSDQG